MRAPIAITAVALLAAAALSGGCGRSTSPTATTTPTGSSDATALAAIAATEQAMQNGDSLAPPPPGPPPGPFGLPSGIPSGCPWDAGTQSFICSEVRPDGITDTHGYQFLDENTQPQAAYDSLTTAAVRCFSTRTGTHTRDGHWGTVDEHRELRMGNLLGAETTRIWDGTGESARQDSVPTPGGMVLPTSHASTVVDQVVVPAPFLRESWPLSGTITTHVTDDLGLDLTSVLTFNGTEYATLTIGDRTVTVDLAYQWKGCGPIPGGGGHRPPPPPH